MSVDICSRQSRELAMDIDDTLHNASDNIAKLTRLNKELLEKQLSDDNSNNYSLYEEIGECENNIENDMRKTATAIYNIVDLIFIALKESKEEIGDEIIDNEYETDYEIKEINYRIDDIEDAIDNITNK